MIPVYHGSRDNITGVVNIKSLARFLGERPSDWEDALADIPVKQFAVTLISYLKARMYLTCCRK